MVDVFSSVTKTGYGKRVKDSIGGIVVGFLFFIGGFPLLWWNEGRAVTEMRSLEEGASAVVAVSADRVDAANEGKLVHLSGTVKPVAQLQDGDFGLSLSALGLKRRVEMYQWKEKRESKERKTLGGGTETVTEYRYEKTWDDEYIDSSRFEHPEGHANPGGMPLQSARQSAERAHLGAFELDSRITARFDDWRKLAPTAGENLPEGFRLTQEGYYRGADQANPKVGDVRVRFEYVPEGVYSLVAKQLGAGLAEYPTQAGNPILLVEQGAMPAEKMFEAAKRRNSILTWILRGVGFFAMFMGLGMVFKPLAVIADVVPLLGTIVSKGVGLVAFVLALIFALLTIGTAWIFHRPLLGAALITAGVAAVLLLKRKRAPAAMPAPATVPSAAPPHMPPPLPPPPPRT
jgi:hypothetical protein